MNNMLESAAKKAFLGTYVGFVLFAAIIIFGSCVEAATAPLGAGEISFGKKMLGEGVSALLLLGLNVIVWRAGRERIHRGRSGWLQIRIGFLLMLMTAILDMVDNLPVVKLITIIGTIDLYTVLKIVEEFAGNIGGLVFLSIGLLRWTPTVNRLAREIEEREKSEKALDDSRQSYRKLFESANDAILMENPTNGHIVDANQIATRWLGYSLQELMELEPQDIEGVKDRGRSRQVRQELQVKDRVVFEHIWRHKNGSEFPVEISSRLIDKVDSDGGTILSIIRDISERKRAEAQFRQVQDGLAKAQEIARLGSWDWDIATDASIWSDEFYNIFGFVRNEVDTTHQTFLDAIHPESLSHASRALDQCLLNPDTKLNIDFRILRPDGQERTINCQGEVIRNEKGEPIRMMGLVLDVTERKHVEEALEKQRVFMSSILKNAVHLGIIALDEDMVVQFFNPAAERIFNCKSSDMIGRSVIEIHGGQGVNPALFEAGLRKVQETGEHIFYFRREEFAGGEELNARVSHIQDDAGNRSGYLLTVQRAVAAGGVE
ncbi:MAG: PAS domain S-box protein [Magnetococcales bacterium]|nr:PAS domain S-box protein [Magnetococcales bacterium]